MKFTVNKEQIINELQSLAAVADKKQTLPILSNILIKCEGSTVKVQSTDLEVELGTSSQNQRKSIQNAINHCKNKHPKIINILNKSTHIPPGSATDPCSGSR